MHPTTHEFSYKNRFIVTCRLTVAGFHCGVRLLELVSYREKKCKRDLLGILNFISINVWKTLFNNRAGSLEKSRSAEREDECTYLHFCYVGINFVYQI